LEKEIAMLDGLIPREPNNDQYVRYARWLLWIIGGSVACAFFPIFMPLHWMAAIHQWLGLGETPTQPIFEYLARSVSGMYFAHGCMVLAISTDVRRFWPLVRVVACLNLLLGVILIVIDSWAGLPIFWTLLEGPPIIMIGAVLFYVWCKA
jgi:hypothetical protein